jgi:hypothetical protein
MLDSGAFVPEPAPRAASLSLGAIAGLFALGAWAFAATGQPARGRWPAAIALGAGGYALVRLLVL